MNHTEPRFPSPIYFNKRRRWKLSELLRWEAEKKGEPAPILSEAEERYLTAAQVQERYGVSDMWIWRRLHPEQEAA